MSGPDLKAIDAIVLEDQAAGAAGQGAPGHDGAGEGGTDFPPPDPKKELARRNTAALESVLKPARDGAANWRYPSLREMVKDDLIDGFAEAWGQGLAKYDIDIEAYAGQYAIELACLFTGWQLSRAVSAAIARDDAARAADAKKAAMAKQGAAEGAPVGPAPGSAPGAKPGIDPNAAGVARRDA